MNRIPSEKYGRVVRLLALLSDPLIEKRLKRGAKEIHAVLRTLLWSGPSRKELKGLARRLRTIGCDLDRTFAGEGEFSLSPKTNLFLNLAEECRSRASDLKYIGMARTMNSSPSKALRRLTYKAFWKHVPSAMLCRELEAPRGVSFREIEELLCCAYSVRGRVWERPARSIEREYKAFLELESSNSLKSKLATLLPKFLDTQLAIVPATK